MKMKFLAAAAVSGIFLTACAGGANASKSLGRADETANIAAEAKADPEGTAVYALKGVVTYIDNKQYFNRVSLDFLGKY